MKLEIDLDAMDAMKLDALLIALGAWKSARFNAVAVALSAAPQISNAKPVEACITGSPEPVAYSPAGDQTGKQTVEVAGTNSASTDAVIEDKPKRVKKAKVEEPVAAEPEPESAATEAADEISIDDLRAALQRLTSEKGMPAGIEMLKEYGCNRVSELAAQPEATKRRFVSECPGA